ncbi:lipid-A-disaccharide synthase [Rhodobium orientis]|uniref:Lipid-A-disaccharide synthase n=1 Tax=Rhodobium orientis TaxID=34017 RepID=A0A327JZW1_9HYPH|nr:lipid-A-disaccharide synthase [Rhodobium orientis]MBB4302452.1 lipid-A-disaccharide synthase [Rhodobium orientis]MBK5949301.1 lipid-A-disaccharide synthase [Rhodobium orientis]RAI28648.1 lipid-A-disaccharide synthase [Rhodobium orientis]
MTAPTRIAIIVGEESGDQLGAALMDALIARCGKDALQFSGTGGERMAARGFKSLFGLDDIAVMGITAVIGRLPLILRRIRETAEAVLAADPDVLVLIDSPDFTHRVARKVRNARPDIPVVDYVSPSVWAWRPGRAKAMRAYVDRVLAILPFEPEAHRRLGGPDCDYVGHPLIERNDLWQETGERARLEDAGRPVLLVLPGSRRGEIERMMPVFGETLSRIAAGAARAPQVLLPAVPHLRGEIEARLADWSVKPEIVSGEAEKFAAFRRAHAALATSGTVSLELALAGVPTVIAYRLDAVYRQINRLRRLFPGIVQVDTMVLPNLILKENAVPEFLDLEGTPERLAAAVLPLLSETPERARQVAAFLRLQGEMTLEGGEAPSAKAARIVLDVAGSCETS